MPVAASLVTSHRAVQRAAKQVLAELPKLITPDDTEQTIAATAYAGLVALGYPDTWYYQCPALVLLGSRSCLSVSGRDYRPGNEPVGKHNLVTVDLSPVMDGHWGDCARSFYIEEGRVTDEPESPALAEGKAFLAGLHQRMQATVRPDWTFDKLFRWTNAEIAAAGFENLDFLGNVGHSIATARADRQFIEASNTHLLSDVPFFTFEPHVRCSAGHWGFKHENIFYFDAGGDLTEL
ncbi:M24 family metallopeptidase [Silvimonas iriomotensis]|uniref:Peptidase M24 domain-containing protein n=1 Tax=Silvimonas iriomotensis TaxID=449662 RepID=A0ABQ2P4V6_9NEIS|nr:M24 family metallopeptidase [Silvimonas iriomotensis]GGP18129.1 hypothetical protein GCM10010970_03320 [Silvimonas iriomotensis]